MWGDHVFVTAATEAGASCQAITIDRKSGEVLWNTEVHRQVPGPKRAQNSCATPAPVSDGERVYAGDGSQKGTSVAAETGPTMIRG